MFEYDDYLGMSGSIFLVVAYFCTTYKTYDNPFAMDFFNLYGSITVGYNCFVKNAYSPMCLEIIWFTIAFVSLFDNICKLIAIKTDDRISMRNEILRTTTYQTL